MLKRRICLGACTALSLWAGTSFAQGPPIHTDTPIMLGIEGRGLRSFVQSVQRHDLRRDGRTIDDPLHRSASATIVPLILPYNFSPTLQVGAAIPFVSKEMTSDSRTLRQSGLSDLSLWVKKLLLQVDGRAKTFRIAGKFSARLPTADSDAALPLGSGSTDFGGSVVGGWIEGRWGTYAEVGYWRTGTRGEVSYGDRVFWNLALGFRAIPTVYRTYPSKQLNLFVELNGSTSGRDRIAGAYDPDRGGTLVFLSPGIQFVGGRRWLVESSVQLPVLRDLHGTQLATSWAATIGGRWLIF